MVEHLGTRGARLGWLGLWPLLAVTACGNSDRATGGSARAGDAGQTSQAGGDATAGGGQSSLGGRASQSGSAGELEEAGRGGSGDARGGASSAGAGPDCTSSLLGDWEASGPLPPTEPDDVCPLAISKQSTGEFYIYAPRPNPAKQQVYMHFGDVVLQVVKLSTGPVTVSYPSACVASGQDGTPTCSQLAQGIVRYDSSRFLSVTCVDAAAGGCDCTMDAQIVDPRPATWRLVDDLLEVTVFPGVPERTETVSTPYCSTGKTLQFGPELDELWPHLSNLVLEPTEPFL